MAVSETNVDPEPLPGIERRQRADAARNRERLLEAASQCFRESGLEVGVSEIAERAGLGRATLFRNFPTKHDLVMAIVIERIGDAVAFGRELIASGEPSGEMVATFVARLAEGQQMDRALFEGIGAEEFLNHADIRVAHSQIVEVLDAMLALDHAAGTVRGDVGALDVLMLVKGACNTSVDLSGEDGRRALARQLMLVRSAISAAAGASWPLPDQALTLDEFEQAHRCPS